MNITEIRHNVQMPVFETFAQKITEPYKKQGLMVEDRINVSSPTSQWQKDILLNALDKLEGKMTLDDAHPLDRKQNQPIETFEEALIELSLFKSAFVKEQAYGAQANILPHDIVGIFVDES